MTCLSCHIFNSFTTHIIISCKSCINTKTICSNKEFIHKKCFCTLSHHCPKLKPGARTKYDRIIEQIIQEISSFPHAEQEEALKDTYLFGYYLQRSALYTSGKTENSQEEE